MAPTEMFPNSRYRSKEGLGVWEHRGKVAIAGVGQSPTARRWDETIENALGAWTILAAQQALDDAGMSKDEIDGVVACPIGMGDTWAPRPYFEPPYDTEDGLSGVSADWLVKNMGLKNVKVTYHAPGCISTALVVGAQVVGDGEAKNVLVIRGTGNMPGRYHQTGGDVASGRAQWNDPWSWQLIPQIAFGFDQYCRKYGTNHDRMAPYILNQRRNGARFPEGYYYQHRPHDLQITTEDYLASRWICKPMNMFDCDLPIQTAGAFLFTTADRAKELKQPPVYVLNHVTQRGVVRSTCETLDETEEFSASIARKVYEGSGLTASEIDIFNPYDGFTLFSQYFLEGFGWHGVKKGEAHDFFAGDIRVEGPHPFSSSGGNNGNGRTRWWIHLDSIQQLRGQAGERQVTVKAETSVSGAFIPGMSDWLVLGKNPS
jgi:acetyl-CoA acetyltransferase